MSTASLEKKQEVDTIRGRGDWVIGFLLLGVLLGLLGSLLIAWRYHINTEPELIGFHFLALNAGHVSAVGLSQRVLGRMPMQTVALLACVIGFASLSGLSFFGPPAPVAWRIGGLFLVGFAGGALATSLLYALEPWFASSPVNAMNLSGALFGAGCALSTAVVGAVYFSGSVQVETALIALIPLSFLLIFLRSPYQFARQPFPARPEQERRFAALQEARNIAAVLFSLLLFLQAGNEFVIAGWLPIFLIHRLGANPMLAISDLAVYFIALTVGRVVARRLLQRMSHRRLLLRSMVVAMVGYVALSLAPSMALVWPATVMVGAGFAPIYPLLAEILDHRFSYHPGFYNGIFSVAVTGAMSMPWLIGYVDKALGAQFILLVPAFGSVCVAVVALLIMLEARLMGAEG